MNLLLLATTINARCDCRGFLYGDIPVFEEDIPSGQVETAMDSPEGRAFLRGTLYQENPTKLPPDKVVDAALDVLKGYALQRPRQEPKQAQQDQKHLPALTALGKSIKRLAEEAKATKKTPTDLHRWLTSYAARQGWLKETLDWPANEDALGHRLNDEKLLHDLRLHGVILERLPKDRPRTYIIRLEQPPPSQSGGSGGEVSVTTSATGESSDNAGTSDTSGTSSPRVLPSANVPEQVADALQEIATGKVKSSEEVSHE